MLPFANLSGEQDAEHFSEGMTEELIHALARIPQLRVASRTSAFSIARQQLDIRRIGEALGVRTVLEGSVKRAGNRLRVCVQLVDTASGYHLWSEKYDREMQDVFAIQDAIARAITARLRVGLRNSDPTQAEPPTRSMDAYHNYLRGRYFWNRPGPQTIRKAMEYFERAIEADPRFAAAHSGLADCYHVLAVYGVIPPVEAYPRMKQAAARAIELDEHSAEGHVSLGCAAMSFDWDWEGALRAFERAIALAPTYSHAHYQYAWCLMALGRREEAVTPARHAAELEPLSLHIQAYVSVILHVCGLFDAAIEQARNTLELDAGFVPAIEALANSYRGLRRYDEAIRMVRQIPPSPLVSQALRLAPLYARTAEIETARQTLTEEEARLADGTAPAGNAAFYLACGALGLGEVDRCLKWLGRLADERRFPACLLKVDPTWEEIRAHPQFLALLHRIGLEEEPCRTP